MTNIPHIDEIDIDIEEENTDLEIQIEDDTPPADRGRTPMPADIVEELENDELDDYDEAAKLKLKQLKKVWHDERRAKEAALREHQEAVDLTRKVLEDNRRLRQAYSTGEKEYITTAQNAAKLEVDAAKQSYREAYESGDVDAIVEAQEKLQMANLMAIKANTLKETTLQEEDYSVQNSREESTPRTPAPDAKAIAWQKRNDWFGTDREMTATALGIHEKLREEGVEVGSDDYYKALDKTMRKRYSEFFGTDKPKPTTVVAPATRSSSPNKVTLRPSQIQLAKRLGITPEQYARELIKLEKQ